MNRPYAFITNIPQKCYQSNPVFPANGLGTWSRFGAHDRAGRPYNFVAHRQTEGLQVLDYSGYNGYTEAIH
jgi:hypothetical protein